MSKAKRLTAVLLCVLCLIPLTACHGTLRERDSAREAAEALWIPPESLDETRSYEISFWAKSDNNKVQTAIYEQAIRDFEALYPNIHDRLKQYFD